MRIKNTRPAISFNENVLTINDGSREMLVQLPSAIKQYEIVDDIIVIRINPKGNVFLNENIYGITYCGQILWQIEKIEHVDIQSPFTGLSCDKGLLKAYNWDDFEYVIDPKTGKIKDKIFFK